MKIFPSWGRKSVMFYVNIISHTDKKSRCLLVDLTWIIQLRGAGIPKSVSLQKDMGMQGSHRIIAQAFNQKFLWLVPRNYTEENSK